MKKRLTLISFILFFVSVNSLCAQGITFFQGTYQQALDEAKKEHKKLFIDFYADWCGPCKLMAKQVFTEESVGDYFNSHFVSVQLNTEKAENKDVVDKYKIVSMPTLMFFDSEGVLVSRNSGSMGTQDFLNLGKSVCGDVESFEVLYKKYKNNPKDLVNAQKLLMEAPGFVSTQEGMDQKKWVIRVNKVYDEYVAAKMGPELINKEDYRIIVRYHDASALDPNDKTMNFFVQNMDAYKTKMGKAPAFFVIEYFNTISQELAKKGDPSYKDILNRIKGDLAPAYEVAPGGVNAQYTMAQATCDGYYALFKEKDIDKYIKLKNDYFTAMGDSVSSLSKAEAAQEMLTVGGSKLTPNQMESARQWLVAAISAGDKLALAQRINVITILGDVCKNEKNKVEAEKLYRQAYAESMQIKEDQMKKYIQLKLMRKIEMLKLE